MSIVDKVCAPFSRDVRLNRDLARRIASDRKLAKEFYSNPLVRQYSDSQISNMYSELQFEATRGKGFGEYEVPTIEELKVQKRLQKEFIKNLESIPGTNLGLTRTTDFYLKSEIFKTNPTMKKAFQEILDSNTRANGRQVVGDRTIQSIIGKMKIASNEFTIGNVGKVIDAKLGFTLRNKLVTMQNRWRRIAEGKEEFDGATGPAAAQEYYIRGNEKGKPDKLANTGDGGKAYVNSLDYLTKEGELKVFADFSKLTLMQGKQFDDLKKLAKNDAKKFERIHGIHPSTLDAAEEFRALMVKRDGHVIEGVDKLSSLLKNTKDSNIKSHHRYEEVLGVLERLNKDFAGRIKRKDSGILPLLTLEVLPQIEGNFYKMFSGKGAEIDEAMDGFLALDKIMQNNLYTASKINTDIGTAKQDFNIFPVLESYNKNTVKFLHTIDNANAYMVALSEVAALKARRPFNPDQPLQYEKFDKSVDMLTKYMHRLFETQSSGDYNTLSDKLVRIATNYQFATKLGWNLKTAIKNASQWTFNYVYFGALGMAQLRNIKNTRENLGKRIIAGRKRSGVFNVNIQETYADMHMPIVKGEDGFYRNATHDGIIDSIDSGMSRIARGSGELMQTVENQINRNTTYDFAYTQEWIRQENDVTLSVLRERFKRQLKNKDGSSFSKKQISDMQTKTVQDELLGRERTEFELEFDKYRQRLAQRHADNIVTFLHYDYSQTQKSFAQTSKVGSLILQFKHYVFSNFIMQKKMIEQGLGDVASGQLRSDAVGRMTRLGGLYLMIETFGDLLNGNAGNIVENAAYEELEKLASLANPEEFAEENREELMQKYFGRGPVAGNLGPTVDTLLDFMSITGIDRVIQNNDTANFLLGLSYAAEKDQDLTMLQKIQFATPLPFIGGEQGRRLFTKTGPQFTSSKTFDGKMAAISRNTFSMYPKKEKDRFTLDLGLFEVEYPDFIKRMIKTAEGTMPKLKQTERQYLDYSSDVLKVLDKMED